MPRNSSGTYSTPAGQPAVSGTVISSTTFNSLVSDLSTEVTDSASRSGKGGFLAPVRGIDGTVAVPAISFTGETGTGLYRAGAGDVRLSVLGTARVSVTAARTTIASTALTVPTAVAATDAAQYQDVTNHTGDATGAHAASAISNTPAGGIAATDVQTALNELDTEKANLASPTFTGTVTVPTPSNATDAATKGYVDTLSDGKASITWGTDWAETLTYTSLRKQANGVVVFNLWGTSSGTSTTACTLPAGYRPPNTMQGFVMDRTTATVCGVTINSNGTVDLNATVTTHQYAGTLTFPTT